MPKTCNCGQPAKYTLNLTDADGVLIDYVHFCQSCMSFPGVQCALDTLDLYDPKLVTAS